MTSGVYNLYTLLLKKQYSVKTTVASANGQCFFILSRADKRNVWSIDLFAPVSVIVSDKTEKFADFISGFAV